MKFYSKKRVIFSIAISMAIFIIIVASVVDSGYNASGAKITMSGILGVFITLAILLPKIWWNFLLDRVRELSRAMKDED